MKESWYIRNGLNIKDFRDGQHELSCHAFSSKTALTSVFMAEDEFIKNVSVFIFKFEYGLKNTVFSNLITLFILIVKFVLKYWRTLYLHFLLKNMISKIYIYISI